MAHTVTAKSRTRTLEMYSVVEGRDRTHKGKHRSKADRVAGM